MAAIHTPLTTQETKYWFVKTKLVTNRIQVFPLDHQFVLDAGDMVPVKTSWKVLSDSDIRSEYPVGTYFCVEEFRRSGKGVYYEVKGQKLWAVELPKTGVVAPITATAEMLVAWGSYAKNYLTVGAEEVQEVQEEFDTRAEPLFKRLKRDEHFRVPTIEEDGYYIDSNVWYTMVRNLKKNKNTLLVGPSGTAKTELVLYLLAERFKLQVKYVDMGTTKDAITTLLGTHRLKDGKSVFDTAPFVDYIQGEGIVLLEEISRAPADANNILFPCLDKRRVLSLDMAHTGGDRKVNVSDDVTFFATANLGSEYAGTNSLDRALMDRFTILEINYPPMAEEIKLLRHRNKTLTKVEATQIAGYFDAVRIAHDNGELSTSASTRQALEVASLVADGMEIRDAASISLFPFFEGTKDIGERSIIYGIFSAR